MLCINLCLSYFCLSVCVSTRLFNHLSIFKCANLPLHLPAYSLTMKPSLQTFMYTASMLKQTLTVSWLVQIPFFKELGINAVELLPVFEYDELEFQRTENPRDHMVNIWGYSHLSFFAPNSRMAADGGGPSAARREFKDLVKALHKAGIKVILDVVYNHTVEGVLLHYDRKDCSSHRAVG
jgi:hypothetical protein